MKLTLVSITFRGQRYSFFCMLPVDGDGRAVADYEKLAAVVGVPLGCTYTLS